MSGKYNNPKGTKDRPAPVLETMALDAGKWVVVKGALWSSHKAMFWVDFGDGRREWRRAHQVAFQGVLPF